MLEFCRTASNSGLRSIIKVRDWLLIVKTWSPLINSKLKLKKKYKKNRIRWNRRSLLYQTNASVKTIPNWCGQVKITVIRLATYTALVISIRQKRKHGIDPELSTVQYTSFDRVSDMVASLGKNAVLVKMDVLSAFRLLIIHPDDFELFGFKFKDHYFFDKCLPMGCSASCALFEKIVDLSGMGC